MIERLKNWWAGEFRPKPLDKILKDEPFENIIRPWPVRAWHAIRRFVFGHWQFLIGSAIAVAGVVAAFKQGGP